MRGIVSDIGMAVTSRRWSTATALYRAHKPLGYGPGITSRFARIFTVSAETGVGSLVNTMANGQAAEVGTIGNEGVVGLPLLLGDDRAPTSVYVQVPGPA